LYILVPTGQALIATFGESAQIGKSNANNDVWLTLTKNGVAIRKKNNNGVDVILANFTASGMSFRDENGNVLASFNETDIRIGTSTEATISMCGGKAQIALDGTTLKIYGGSNVGAIGLSNSYGTYKSEVVCEAKNNSPKASMQVMNGSSTIASLVMGSSGANVTVPSNTALTENGKEVAKLNAMLAVGVIHAQGTIDGAQHHMDAYDDVILMPGRKNLTVTVSGIPDGNAVCEVLLQITLTMFILQRGEGFYLMVKYLLH